MSWAETKYALNSTLGNSENFKPLDKIIETFFTSTTLEKTKTVYNSSKRHTDESKSAIFGNFTETFNGEIYLDFNLDPPSDGTAYIYISTISTASNETKLNNNNILKVEAYRDIKRFFEKITVQKNIRYYIHCITKSSPSGSTYFNIYTPKNEIINGCVKKIQIVSNSDDSVFKEFEIDVVDLNKTIALPLASGGSDINAFNFVNNKYVECKGAWQIVEFW